MAKSQHSDAPRRVVTWRVRPTVVGQCPWTRSNRRRLDTRRRGRESTGRRGRESTGSAGASGRFGVLMRMIGVVLGVSCSGRARCGMTSAGGRAGERGNAKSCQKNGWMGLFTRSGQPFSSSGGCTSYRAQGGHVDRSRPRFVPQRRLERCSGNTGSAVRERAGLCRLRERWWHACRFGRGRSGRRQGGQRPDAERGDTVYLTVTVERPRPRPGDRGPAARRPAGRADVRVSDPSQGHYSAASGSGRSAR